MIDILIAFAVVSAVALAAGILLALISHFFGVEEDKRVKQIRSCLPGINCGACGYAGCNEYTNALLSGEEDRINLCIPGADAAARKLSGNTAHQPRRYRCICRRRRGCRADDRIRISGGCSYHMDVIGSVYSNRRRRDCDRRRCRLLQERCQRSAGHRHSHYHRFCRSAAADGY